MNSEVEIPVIVSVPSPLTLITLDENDKLNAKIEDINHNTYDRLKLCRTTSAIDSKIPLLSENNMAAIIGYTCTYIFPAMKGLDRQSVIDATNHNLFKLLLGGIPFDSIADENVGFGMLYETGYYMLSGGATGPEYAFLQAAQQQATSSFEAIKLLNPRTYTKTEFHDALLQGEKWVNKFPNINTSLLLDGITHYKYSRLASALVFLWSNCEFSLNMLWENKVMPKGKGIKNRKKFIEGNAWQAAHKVEVLFQLGILQKPLYEQLNTARSARNKLAHDGLKPKLEDCESALEATFTLLSLIASDLKQTNLFSDIARNLKNYHEPITKKLEPKYWRPFKPVPGSKEWEGQEFPRYKEIELKRLKPKT